VLQALEQHHCGILASIVKQAAAEDRCARVLLKLASHVIWCIKRSIKYLCSACSSCVIHCCHMGLQLGQVTKSKCLQVGAHFIETAQVCIRPYAANDKRKRKLIACRVSLKQANLTVPYVFVGSPMGIVR
jgi:hypothetical protein